MVGLDFTMVGHVGEHEVVGGASVAGEDKALTESCIEAAMGFRGEPDEVGGAIVADITIQMMTFHFDALLGGSHSSR